MTEGNLFIESPKLLKMEKSPSHPCIWGITPHNHTHPEIYFIEEGKGECQLDSNLFAVQAGDLILLNPGVSHELKSSQSHPLRGFSVEFSHLHLQGKPKYFLTLPNSPSIYRLSMERHEIVKYLHEMCDETTEKRLGYHDLISSLLQKFIVLCFRSISSQNESSPSISQFVKRHIELHCTEDLTLNDLANLVFVSPYYLSHLFKEEVGVPPIQYLTYCRMEKAKKLLIQTKLSITEIASILGYESANYFNFVFKKTTGISPGKFRKNNT